MKRGQLFSIDLVVGVAIFLFILLVSFYIWEQTTSQIAQAEERIVLLDTSRAIALSLIDHPGNPSNWTNLNFSNSTIYSLGLAQSISLNSRDSSHKGKSGGFSKYGYGMIDIAKVEKLVAQNVTNYDRVKTLLGIHSPSTEIFIELFMWNQNEFTSNYTFGRKALPSAKVVVRSDRYALINETWGHFVISVWNNCEIGIC